MSVKRVEVVERMLVKANAYKKKMFFVETDFIYIDAFFLKKNKVKSRIDFFRNLKSQLLLLSFLEIGQQEVANGSH